MMSLAIGCQSEDAKSVLHVPLWSRLVFERKRTVSEKFSKWDHLRYGTVLGCHVIAFLAFARCIFCQYITVLAEYKPGDLLGLGHPG
jgi:hypothetical protein